jgi:hypothetical protein
MRAARIALSMHFYWVNMAPLSRGSAAVGFTTILGVALACDLPVRGATAVCLAA